MQTNRKVVVVGLVEVWWDLLPGGKRLGGAPANFAGHAQMLGAEAWLVSRVGNDSLGRQPMGLAQNRAVRPTRTWKGSTG
jgi:fructokinase